MTSNEKAIYWRMINEIYDQFGVVARGRGLSTERVNEIGGGRVWTGGKPGRWAWSTVTAILSTRSTRRPSWPLYRWMMITLCRSLTFMRSSSYALPPPTPSALVEEIGRLLGGERLKTLEQPTDAVLPYNLRFW